MARASRVSFRRATSSPEETRALGRALGRLLSPGDVAVLIANLGGGKTTFVQGVLSGAGVEDEGLSPTFILAQTFEGRLPVHHMDFYRVSKREIADAGLEDYFSGRGEIPAGAVLIEWAERCRELWPADRLEIRLRHGGVRNRRAVAVTGVGRRSAALARRWKDAA